MIRTVTIILIAGACAAGGLFVVVYATWTRWRDTEHGRHMMAFMFVIASLLTLALATALFGRDYAGREVVRLGAYTLLNWVLWWRLYLLCKTQLQQRRWRRAAPGIQEARSETDLQA